MEVQLKVWETTIEKLAAKAEKARGQGRIDFQYHVDDLKARRALALVRLSEFRAASAASMEKREDFKARLEIAWTELEAAFKALGLHP